MHGIISQLKIEINSTEIIIKEYKGCRVVTFADIDIVHGRPAGTARRNFNNNKEHFIEGEDYFVRNSYEAKTEFGITAPNGLILLAESGYLMLVKSFTDNLSWTVQRQLVRSYFRGSEINYTEIIERLYLLEQNQKRTEQKIDMLNKKSDNIIKSLFDISSNVISKGLQIIYDKLSR